ncbi:hypothetical protein, partial [Methylomonas albis]
EAVVVGWHWRLAVSAAFISGRLYLAQDWRCGVCTDAGTMAVVDYRRRL